MDKFWSLTENKVNFKQFFIKWVKETYSNSESVYLRGSHVDDTTSCVLLSNGNITLERLLKCDHEEADDRILFYVNHGVKVEKFRSVIIASPDTDIFICSIYHFNRFVFFGLNELWFRTSKLVVPVHDIVNDIDSDVVDVLPAVHALTGCDTTSKIGTKAAALKTAFACGIELLHSFGKTDISDEMIANAEKFLLNCITSNCKFNYFDELRYHIYHTKTFQLDLEKLPPTSSSIKLHIKRAYLQTYMWLHAPFIENIAISRVEYGYIENSEEHIIPIVVSDVLIPPDFPSPCNCMKCSKSNVCKCRIKQIACCRFCKCEASVGCKNSLNNI